jgi:hypothetical protein
MPNPTMTTCSQNPNAYHAMGVVRCRTGLVLFDLLSISAPFHDHRGRRDRELKVPVATDQHAAVDVAERCPEVYASLCAATHDMNIGTDWRAFQSLFAINRIRVSNLDYGADRRRQDAGRRCRLVPRATEFHAAGL